MDQAAAKLARRYGISTAVAQALVDAGFRNPVRIERATKTDLRKVRGVGPSTADKLKAKRW